MAALILGIAVFASKAQRTGDADGACGRCRYEMHFEHPEQNQFSAVA
jgi:hypothetical protein